MQLSTKKCILTYSGAIMFTFGFALMILGIFYFGNVGFNGPAPLVVRAVPHWCGMLLILLGARNFTFGLAQWKYGMNCCGNGACEVICVNFMALLVSLAAAGLPIYSSFDYISGLTATSAGTTTEFVYLVSLWFMGLISAILSLLSICAGCLPVGSPSDMDDDERRY